MSDKLIEFSQVNLGYGSKTILKDLSFTVARGQYIGLVGANGAGKTTLLKAIIGALTPSKGKISYFDSEGREVKRIAKLGYMPQHQSLDKSFPLSVFDVVLMGRYALMGRRTGENDKKAVLEALEQVKMADYAYRHISELSGGQLQRILMARAIVAEPELLLLDEPTNGMDLGASQDTLDIVHELHKKGLTVIIVTHMLDIVARHAQTVGLFHHHEGSTGLKWGEPGLLLSDAYLSELYGRPLCLHYGHSCHSEPRGEA